jgi:hypothetical protein
MREGPAAFGLLLFAGVMAVLASAAVHDLGIATALAAGAAGVAGGGLLVLLLPAIRRRHSAELPLVGAPLLLLRESFESGPIGRQTIVTTVNSLEQANAGTTPHRMTPDEERHLIAVSPAKFRAWLDEHLERLEQET